MHTTYYVLVVHFSIVATKVSNSLLSNPPIFNHNCTKAVARLYSRYLNQWDLCYLEALSSALTMLGTLQPQGSWVSKSHRSLGLVSEFNIYAYSFQRVLFVSAQTHCEWELQFRHNEQSLRFIFLSPVQGMSIIQSKSSITGHHIKSDAVKSLATVVRERLIFSTFNVRIELIFCAMQFLPVF